MSFRININYITHNIFFLIGNLDLGPFPKKTEILCSPCKNLGNCKPFNVMN